MVVFKSFYQPIKSLLLGAKCVFKHTDLQIFCLKLKKINMSNFRLLEVVGHGSETQL